MSDQNKFEPVSLGHERFHRLTASEKVIWATTYVEVFLRQVCSVEAASRAACSAVNSARVLAGRTTGDKEDHFMLCEVVNLEAALGGEYRKELAPLFGGQPDDVDDELAGVLRWLDHGRFKLSALALRMELHGADLVPEDDRDRDDLVGLLKIMASAARSHIEHLQGGKGEPEKVSSIEYVVFAAPDGTELGLISSRQWEDQPALHRSPATGRPMTVVARFFAASWDAAKVVCKSMSGIKFDVLACANAEIARLQEIVDGYVKERTRLDVETTRIQGTTEASKYSHESAFDTAIRLLRDSRPDVASNHENAKRLAYEAIAVYALGVRDRPTPPKTGGAACEIIAAEARRLAKSCLSPEASDREPPTKPIAENLEDRERSEADGESTMFRATHKSKD
jgi:hypothetical protein